MMTKGSIVGVLIVCCETETRWVNDLLLSVILDRMTHFGREMIAIHEEMDAKAGSEWKVDRQGQLAVLQQNFFFLLQSFSVCLKSAGLCFLPSFLLSFL